MKKIKGQFWYSVPPDPIPSNSAFGLVLRKCVHWTPEGHCGCFATQMYRPIRTIKTPHQNSNFMSPPSQKMSLTAHKNSNFMPPTLQKIKNLTPTPNLTSNSIPSNKGHFWYSVPPVPSNQMLALNYQVYIPTKYIKKSRTITTWNPYF